MEDKKIYITEKYREKFTEVLTKNYFDNQKKQVEIVDGGVILPAKKQINDENVPIFTGGVLDKDGNFVTMSQNWRGETSGSLMQGYSIVRQDVEYSEKEIIYAGLLVNHFGHFLMESTNRLWYWLEHQELELAFILSKKQPATKQFWEFIELLGIPRERVHLIKKTCRFAKVYVPAPSHTFCHAYNEKFLAPFQYISSKVVGEQAKKIYLSRTKLTKGDRCLGEDIIEKLFKDNGFKIIYPEKLPLKKQIAYIKGAETIAGVSGTAMHLEVFASSGIQSFILERSDMSVQEQTIVHQALNADWYSIGANMNPFAIDHAIGPWLLGITEEFDDFCRNKGLKVSKELVGYISKKNCKIFIKEYMKKYTQISYNKFLMKQDPLLAIRLFRMAKAYVPWKRKIKQKWKNWRNKTQ